MAVNVPGTGIFPMLASLTLELKLWGLGRGLSRAIIVETLQKQRGQVMRVVVIGGTGHIGSYLTPQLIEAGHEVACVSRGLKEPYREHAAWRAVQHVVIDRNAEEEQGRFGERIAGLDAEVVIDLTCYRMESARQLVAALRGRVAHLLHCGTIWVHGPSIVVPTAETQARRPFGDYGIRKAAIEAFLRDEAKESLLPVTVLHPGHLVGPGWVPVNPAGNFNPEVFSLLAQGRTVRLPNFGMETLHHVHAEDVAQSFVRAMERRDLALGESFHIVSGAAVSLRGYAETVATWFDQDALLEFLPWEAWRSGSTEKDSATTWDHIAHSPNCSIAKAQRLLGYVPRYSSLEAIRESLSWLVEQGLVRVQTGEVSAPATRPPTSMR